MKKCLVVVGLAAVLILGASTVSVPAESADPGCMPWCFGGGSIES